MANEFKIKHGFISTGNGSITGELRITGAAYADNNSRVATRPWVTQYLTDNSYATSGDISTAISNLVDSAPGTLDTLNELAAALGDDPNFATTVTNSIATKVSKGGDTMTGALEWDTSAGTTNTHAKIVYGQSPSPDGSLNGMAQVANYGADGYGLLLHVGYGESDNGGIKITDDGVVVWGASDENVFTVIDEDSRSERFRIDNSGNIAASGNITAAGGISSAYLTNSGGAKLEIQNGVDGTPDRGIYMWNIEDPNWGIYMSTSGAGKSLGGGTATAGIDGVAEHAIRFRVNDNSAQAGFIWENSSEVALMQMNGGSGHLYVNGRIYPSNQTTDYVDSTRIKNWDTAYGWGNHASEGYLTSYTETDTLATVVARGQSTSQALVVTAVDSGNPSAASNSARLSGYGLLGNRGTFYLTNGGGVVQIGTGATHAANPVATFGNSIVHHHETVLETYLNVEGSSGIRSDGWIHLHRYGTNLNVSVGNNGSNVSLLVPNGNIETQQNIKSRGYLLFDNDGNFSGGNYYTMEDHVDGYFRMGYAFNSNLVISTAGNIGIGTTDPTKRLHIRHDGNAPTGLLIQNLLDNNGTNDGDAAAEVFLNAASNNAYFRVHGAPTDSAAEHEVEFGTTAGSSFFTFKPSGNERMRITNGGNVGIGTASPTKKLHVDSDSNEVAFFKGNSGGAWIDIQSSTSNLWSIGAVDANKMGIYNRTNATYPLVVENGGNVGIGTSSPTTKLQVGATSTNSISPVASLGSASAGILSALSLVNTEGNAAAGYGVAMDFHVNSGYSPTGRIATIAENTSTPAALAFYTYNGGLNKKMQISSNGNIRFHSYGAGILKTDANGNVSLDTNTYLTSVPSEYLTQTEGDARYYTQDQVDDITHQWDWKWQRWTGYLSPAADTAEAWTTYYKTYFTERTEATDSSYAFQGDGYVNTLTGVGTEGGFGGSTYGNIFGNLSSYHALVYTNIYVDREFTVNITNFNGDDAHAIFIDGKFVHGRIPCCTDTAYNYTFKQGWHRIDLIFAEGGGGDYIRMGWNPKDYLDYILDMTPHRGGENPNYIFNKLNSIQEIAFAADVANDLQALETYSNATFLQSVPDDISVTSVTVGGTRVDASIDRPGLLEIERNGSNSYAGIMTRFSGTAEWALMGDEGAFGLYDDQNNDWAWRYTENSGLVLYHNGVVKAATNAAGFQIKNTLELGAYADTNGGVILLNGTIANKQAKIHCTNGNLHIDSEEGNAIYLNYYTGNADNVIFGNGNGGNSGAKVTSGGVIYATGGNSGNWNTAYGWGNHAGLYLGATAKAADSEKLDGIDSTGFLRVAPNSNTPLSANFAIGNAGGRNFIQTHAGQPLDINPLGNTVNVGSNLIVSGNLYPVQPVAQLLGLDSNRWQIVFCEILDSAGLHEKNLQNPEGEKQIGEYATGTVLVWKGGKNVPCTEYADHMRMGIAVKDVSSPLVQGAEPVLVTGVVKEGDYLVTSRKEGHAEAISPELMRQQGLYDCVLGKALENGEGESYLLKTWVNI